MTSSGTSAVDALHQAYDQTAYYLGLGGADPNQPAGSDEGHAAHRDGDSKRPSHESERPPQGPGNHPNDSSHPAYGEGQQQDSSGAPDEEPQQNPDKQDEEQGEYTQQAAESSARYSVDASGGGKGKKEEKAQQSEEQEEQKQAKPEDVRDAIERALGPTGPVASRNAQGAAAGDASPRYTRQEAHEEHPEQSKKLEEHVDRGPVWASRPDDEQREKIRRMKEERAERAKHHHLSFLGRHKEEREEKHEEKEKAKGDKEEEGGAPSQQKKPLSALLPIRRRFSGSQPSTPAPAGPSSQPQTPTSAGGAKAASRPALKSPSSQWSTNDRAMRGAWGGNQQPMTAEPEEDEEAASPRGRKSGASQDTPERPRSTSKKHSDSPVASPRLGSSSRQNTGGSAAARRSGSGEASDGVNSKMTRISKLMLGKTDDVGDASTGEAAGQAAGGGDEEKTPSSPPVGVAKWGVLKQKINKGELTRGKNLRSGATDKQRAAGPMSVVTELQSGILPVFMLKMSIERDEQKHRRIPVLLNHLKLRITDSVNPLNNTHAVFRIELEYGDGLVRWVCYRELRDFINLHAHYRAAALRGYLGRPVGQAEGDVGLPSFPKTSLPYLNQLQRQGRGKDGGDARASFAKAQRDALEDYVIELIRRTMFRPEANRICKFFELSALSISLASRGGYQGKQGYLRIMSKSSRKDNQKGILTPVSWAKSHEPKWFIVRESYIVVVDEPDELQVYDVFLIDGDFAIERPKRFYKQTIHLASELASDDKDKDKNGEKKDSGTNPEHAALLTDGQYGGETGADDDSPGSKSVSSHTFYIRNAQQRLRLVAKTERLMRQFIGSLERVAARNIFSGSNRFGSFAPIRLNCSAQWLIDGRDYFWNLSKALLMAKDRIFIHDWWLSPEVYLRRPGTPKYRLDNILKKKASEGVKIFVIVYNEVSNNFTPTDSNYTKQRLIGLHPNIFVQRSPSHFQTGTFYWAHHEKLCVIDETIAFMGGLDLCFGRWDTPAHVLTDDSQYDPVEGNLSSANLKDDPALLGPGRDGSEAHIWPGQDYANERVMEWHDLTKPANDLIDRQHHPRMPWHDVGVQLVGQPARDLCRHFIQRWNYLLRIKNHKRLMPFLIPPPDFQPSDLTKYQLTGTCEAQICRSAGPWSMGTATTVEHSIQNAYLKAIQMSEHFVYIENQFFVTSTVVRGTEITNQIGEALVSRIIRAHREGTKWRAVIIIPLIPGFPMPIDHPDAGSVRLIVECQNRSICRGEHSIFGKLKRQGINPDDYISFFSLRQWGKLRGGKLSTEIGYIHAKCMVVDDRLAIIGSANINERSQRGDRDSELAVVIRDTDMIDSTMAGKPFKVGRFAHTMRVRLMREHLGVDVDDIEAQEAANVNRPPASRDGSQDEEDDQWDPDHEQRRDGDPDAGQTRVQARTTAATQFGRTVGQAVSGMANNLSNEIRNEASENNPLARGAAKALDSDDQPKGGDEEGATGSTQDYVQDGDERAKRIAENPENPGSASNRPVVPTLEERFVAEQRQNGGSSTPRNNNRSRGGSVSETAAQRRAANGSSHDLKHKQSRGGAGGNPWALPAETPEVDKDNFTDPVCDEFFRDVWLASAVHNTDIFRRVFKATPDDNVLTWSEFKAWTAWYDRLQRSFRSETTKPPPEQQGPPPGEDGASLSTSQSRAADEKGTGKSSSAKVQEAPSTLPRATPKMPNEGFSPQELDQMEALLGELQGTLVMHSTRFLEAEDLSDNMLFSLDRVGPLQVYN